MSKCIMIGIDAHDNNLVMKWAVDRGPMEKLVYQNRPESIRKMADQFQALREREGATQLVAAYEASGLGFVLHDRLTQAGIECHVLAPTKMPKSTKSRRQKSDDRDAEQVLELIRGHLLAGNELPAVWIPDEQTRDDRDLVRARLDVSEKAGRLKTQIKALLKRRGIEKPGRVGETWSRGYRRWLAEVLEWPVATQAGLRLALGSLLRQLAQAEEEIDLLDQELKQLAAAARHERKVAGLERLRGVGLLTALVYLTEMGDLERFRNRRQVGAYLGLAPDSHESGQIDDRKGHITHAGPSRVRKLLCQAAWSCVAHDERERAVYLRIVERNPKHNKIAVVAVMRRLGVRMWHVARAAEREALPAPTPRRRQTSPRRIEQAPSC